MQVYIFLIKPYALYIFPIEIKPILSFKLNMSPNTNSTDILTLLMALLNAFWFCVNPASTILRDTLDPNMRKVVHLLEYGYDCLISLRT